QISLKRVFFLLVFAVAGVAASFSQNKIQCIAPTISVSANFTICNGQSTTLTATVTGPTSPNYSYAWTQNPTTGGLNPANTTTASTTNNTVATPTTTTTYTVIVTDGVFCTSLPATVTVTVVNPSTASISYTGSPWCTSAGTQTVALTGTAGGTYTFSPAGLMMDASGTITPGTSTAGTYTVTYTVASPAPCSAVNATTVVTINAIPSLTLSGTNTICIGTNTTLNVSGASSYVWSPSGSLNSAIISNPVASPTTSTNYTVVATGANSCTVTTSYSVTVYATPTVTVSGTNTVCSGLPTTLTASGGISYVWSPGGATTTNVSVAPTNSTNYSVVGTDANTCTNSSSYSVTVYPQPIASAGADVSVCLGDNTTFNGTGNGTFLWSPSTYLNCTTCANPVATPTSTAVITYTLTVTNNCGSATDEISLTYPALPSAYAGPDVTICPGAGTSTTLTGTGSGTFVWSPSGTLSCISCASPVATPTATTTTYTFSITASCGTNSDDVTVTIANPVAGITGNTTVCSGQTTTLTASGGVSYSWSTGAITNPITANPITSTTYTVIATDGSGCTDSDVITVNPSPLPTASPSPDVSICAGASTSLSVTGSGTYAWTPAANLSCTTCANPVANPTSNITYTVTVTNSCGSVSDSVTVSITATPSVNAGADATICIGASAPLNASGGSTYSWSPASGLNCTTCANPVANPTGTTDYTVTITDVCGTASDVVTVNVNSLPAAGISGNSTICLGSSSTLTATGGGTYSWNVGNTNAIITVNPTITSGYSVTVTDGNGCTNTANFTVNVSSVTALISGTSSSICSGSSATLTASGGGTYVWNTAETTTSIVVSPTVATGYSVVATNPSGCTDSDTYSVSVIAQPTASVTAIGGSTTMCSGSSTSLTASGGASYVWSPATGLDNSNISNPVSSSTANITYTVTVSNGGCSSVASISITVNAVPSAALTATQMSICIGSCSTLSATGGLSYVWAPGGSTSSVISVCPASSTTYTVTTTDANGCTDDASALINVLPLVNAIVTGDTVICSGDLSMLTASGGSMYSWNTGQITPSISVNPVANTSYTVTASNGACSDFAVINVNVNPSPTADATASPYTINIGATTTLTGLTSTGTYTWSPTTGLSCDTCANPAANPTVTTIYTVTTIDINGCTSLDTVIVNVTMECEDIFVPSAFSPNNDGFNDLFYVRNPCILDMEFTVYNRWGQKVFFTTDQTEKWDGRFHGKPVDPAVFFYTLNINFITGTSKYIDGNVTLVR
ncbi:MAG: T9SS type B sorting domain-containing protein, partial [Bacteroidetes bacterium]